MHNNFLWSHSSDDFLILSVCAACVRIKTPIHAFVEARVVVDCFSIISFYLYLKLGSITENLRVHLFGDAAWSAST